MKIRNSSIKILNKAVYLRSFVLQIHTPFSFYSSNKDSVSWLNINAT